MTTLTRETPDKPWLFLKLTIRFLLHPQYCTEMCFYCAVKEISRFGTMILAFISVILVLVTLPFSLCYCVKVVQEYERAVIFRLGRLKKGGASGPGLFFILPCIDKYSCVDLRTVSYEVPPQEMLSRDSVTVSVDAVCFYKVNLLHSETYPPTNIVSAKPGEAIYSTST